MDHVAAAPCQIISLRACSLPLKTAPKAVRYAAGPRWLSAGPAPAIGMRDRMYDRYPPTRCSSQHGSKNTASEKVKRAMSENCTPLEG